MLCMEWGNDGVVHRAALMQLMPRVMSNTSIIQPWQNIYTVYTGGQSNNNSH